MVPLGGAPWRWCLLVVPLGGAAPWWCCPLAVVCCCSFFFRYGFAFFFPQKWLFEFGGGVVGRAFGLALCFSLAPQHHQRTTSSAPPSGPLFRASLLFPRDSINIAKKDVVLYLAAPLPCCRPAATPLPRCPSAALLPLRCPAAACCHSATSLPPRCLTTTPPPRYLAAAPLPRNHPLPCCLTTSLPLRCLAAAPDLATTPLPHYLATTPPPVGSGLGHGPQATNHRPHTRGRRPGVRFGVLCEKEFRRALVAAHWSPPPSQNPNPISRSRLLPIPAAQEPLSSMLADQQADSFGINPHRQTNPAKCASTPKLFRGTKDQPTTQNTNKPMQTRPDFFGVPKINQKHDQA